MRSGTARATAATAALLSGVLVAVILVAAGAALGDATPLVAERPDQRFFRLLDEAVERGEITSEHALVNKLRYVFAPDAVDPRFRVENPTPLKCATDLVREYQVSRAALSPAAVVEIEGYLSRSAPSWAQEKFLATYNSPGGKFRLTYSTTGTNAVPADDVDPANGVPDFVEWCAAYCDSSWKREVDELGFTAPALNAGKYDIGFEEMGAYGYTTTSGSGTRIVLHRNFLGFPPNDDPDGDQKGAAKVTVAHEFKHATQYQGSFWSEGGWVELDATWAEDAVYDSTNDYYNYIDSGSPIAAPATPLDWPSTGSYEDCIWQEYMSQTYGNTVIRDIWERRKTNQSETMKTTYDSVLIARGSSMPDGYEEFMQWCYLTGARATYDLFGRFGEAPDYPTSPLVQTSTTLPYSYSGSVNHLAANFFQVVNPGTFTGNPRIVFTGTAGSLLQLHVVYHRTDGSESAQEVALDGANSANAMLTHSWPNLSALGVLVINPKKSGSNMSYSFTVSQESPTDVAALDAGAGAPARFALEQNVPNPAAPVTRVPFRLAEASPVHLGVYDAAGRLVARLVDGATLAAGPHAIVWDGRNDAGRDVAAGVYAYRLVAGRLTETRKLLLVR